MEGTKQQQVGVKSEAVLAATSNSSAYSQRIRKNSVPHSEAEMDRSLLRIGVIACSGWQYSVDLCNGDQFAEKSRDELASILDDLQGKFRKIQMLAWGHH
ncbi:hypothetical protein [Neptuniibacter halophilus]|uniref:hypothetical protein n=1 Tax=Neptuniibacter halophilus TaxID=651666 RepID=UPI0025724153|nr:hypothetical protein [Neptuniibacter halophilus]